MRTRRLVDGERLDCYAWSLSHRPRRSALFEIAPRGSGKSTKVEALRQAYGADYIKLVRPDALADAKYASGGASHNGDLLAFGDGARIVFAQEAGSRKMDISLLNTLTGDREIPGAADTSSYTLHADHGQPRDPGESHARRLPWPRP